MMLLVSGSPRMVTSLAQQWAGQLGHLLTPANGNSVQAIAATGLRWAVDNGAYSGFDEARFLRLLARCRGRPNLLWVVAPDVVANARQTLAQWPWWAVLIRGMGFPAALVLQDGQEDLEMPVADAYFVGGSTRWKLSLTAADLMAEAKRRGKWVHMGRVNSMRRLQLAWDRGADSVDGSSYSRWHHRTITHRPDMSLERHLRTNLHDVRVAVNIRCCRYSPMLRCPCSPAAVMSSVSCWRRIGFGRGWPNWRPNAPVCDWR